MIETHATALLRPELRMSPEGRILDWINGLVAPSFIFAAGFSLALVQVRGARGQGPRWPRVRRSLRRMGEVLAVGVLVNGIWFPWRVEPGWLLRLDILPCLGVSLVLALPLVAGLARRPVVLSVSALLVALGIFLALPYGASVTGPWADLVNGRGPHQSLFPLLPWAGYVFLGASVGALAVGASVPRLLAILVGIAVLGRVFPHLASFVMTVLPPATPYVSNHGQRIFMVALVLMGLLLLESWLSERWRQGLAARFVDTLGMSSLSGYFFHEMLLFGSFWGISLAGFARDQLGWGLFGVSWVGLVVATTLLIHGVEWIYPRYEALLARLGAQIPRNASSAPRSSSDKASRL